MEPTIDSFAPLLCGISKELIRKIMDLSKNPANLYSDELKTDSCNNSKMEEDGNIRKQVEQIDTSEPLCDKNIIANDPDKSISKSAKEPASLEKLELNSENLVGSRKENLEVVDDVETIEKIAEMVAISNKEPEDSSPKLKKRLKVIMSRNHSLNIFNNSDDASSSCVDTSNSPLHGIDNKIENNKTKSLNDQPTKKRKIFVESPKNKSNEIVEESNLKKSPFEEIEDKLEEMFAGIEDEQLTNLTDEKTVSKKFSDSLGKCVKENCIDANKEKDCSIKSLKDHGSVAIKTTHSTEKSENCQKTPISKSVAFQKHMTPQRRLSIGMRKELLKISDDEKSFKTKGTGNDNIDKDILKPDKQDLTLKQVKKNISLDKNKQSKSSKYKKDINFIKSHTNNKKIIRKCETPIKTKHKQRAKEPRTQRLQSSENDAEEKQFQPKDIEAKNRSPYILVKNNGNISVINTVTPDDLNEKLTRSKKPYNYAYERKSVKGCYSSTLGNRYDADTADSSWKCVFCKLGPHKKRLGDLFGPYVISSDCDEYRSIKDSFRRFQTNDSHFSNFANTSYKFNNVSSNSHIKSTFESNCDNFITNQTVGMTQVSTNCYEIWFHEDCAIWAPNIFIVGSRLAGLEEASWKSSRYDCVYCSKQGALLCCLQRGCKTTSHVPCAREFKWILDESKFWSYCNKHTLNKIPKKN